MDESSSRKRYVAAAILGATGGVLLVALAARAIPKMMSRMMSGQMRKMMAQMKEGGCDPREM